MEKTIEQEEYEEEEYEEEYGAPRKRISVWKIVGCVMMFIGLLYFYPNLIHEPLHYSALLMQGSAGHINFDWTHWPAHPSITRTKPVSGIFGGLLFVLMPSIVSVIIFVVLWLTRNKPNLATHFVLLVYLSFDLIINIIGYNGSISDFHFLVAVPDNIVITGVAAILIMTYTGYMCTHTLRVEQLVPNE